MKTKRIISVLLIALLLVSSVSMVSAAGNNEKAQGKKNSVNFSDITKNYGWAKDAIESFAEQGIVQGSGNGKFEPAQMVTREAFTKMLALTFDAPLATPAEPTFSDVPATSWSYPYIEACKEFLTGYVNPFGGKPSFRPTEPATREDIAVALVKIMGLSSNETENSNYAQEMFEDADEISPGLIKYVSLAAESGLIKGNGSGKFEPQKSITRAETVVMLNRATKQAISAIGDSINISASIVPDNRKPDEITVKITAEEGTKVTVDGNIVVMYKEGEGYLKGTYEYKFEQESDKIFKIEATKDGKKRILEVKAAYKVGVPVLNITECPASSAKATVRLAGTLTDTSDREPKLTINGKSAVVISNGEWFAQVTLKEGENKFTFVATNAAGKSTTEERTITFGVGAPTLNIISCPATSSSKIVEITGNAKDANDDRLVITINGKSVYANGLGDFSEDVELKEGENKIIIVATNDLGKSTTVERTITFTAGAPTLVITACPTVATTKTVTIAGTTKDANDRDLTITINGSIVYDSDGSWSKNVTLNDGENKFIIVSTNDSGLSTTIEKTITFNAGAPTLNVISCPATSTTNKVTIVGTAKDANGTRITLTINGTVVYVNGFDQWTKEVSLNAGENRITIVATNEFGKSTTVEKIINYITSSQTQIPTPPTTPPTTPTVPTSPIIEQPPTTPTTPTTPTVPTTPTTPEDTTPGNPKGKNK